LQADEPTTENARSPSLVKVDEFVKVRVSVEERIVLVGEMTISLM